MKHLLEYRDWLLETRSTAELSAPVASSGGKEILSGIAETERKIQESIKKILREETNKPSENEFKQALKDVMTLIPQISHRILHDENMEHNKENMAKLNKIILQKVKEGNDEILDEMWELASSRIMKNAINIITFYTK